MRTEISQFSGVSNVEVISECREITLRNVKNFSVDYTEKRRPVTVYTKRWFRVHSPSPAFIYASGFSRPVRPRPRRFLMESIYFDDIFAAIHTSARAHREPAITNNDRWEFFIAKARTIWINNDRPGRPEGVAGRRFFRSIFVKGQRERMTFHERRHLTNFVIYSRRNYLL